MSDLLPYNKETAVRVTEVGKSTLADIRKIIKECWGEDMVQPRNTDGIIIIDYIDKLK